MKYHLTVFVIYLGILTTNLFSQCSHENRLGRTNTDSYVDQSSSAAFVDDGFSKIDTEVPQNIPLTTKSFLLNTAQDVDRSELQKLVAPGASIKKLVGGMGFTEGPVWFFLNKTLVFSDIPNAKLMEWSGTDGLKLFRASANPNGNLLDLEGRILTCRHGARDIVRTEVDGKLTVLCSRFENKLLNSPNDVAIKSDGTIWFTDPPWGLPNQTEGKEQQGNFVFRLNPKTGQLSALLKTLCMPNGIAFSPDEKYLYIADTGGNWHHDDSLRDRPATISSYKLNKDGTLHAKPTWEIKAFCDGMAVDVTGKIYTTAREGIAVLSPAGKLIATIKVPEAPSNCCFGGDDFKTLFITARTSLYSIDLKTAGTKPQKK